MEPNDPLVDDALLRDFFRVELGADLPPLRLDNAGSPRGRRLALAVAVAAAVVLLVVWAVWTSDGEEEWPELREFTVIESSSPVERITYPTDAGDVVQETTMKRTTIALSEPESGDRIRWSIPEVSIVVQPAGMRPRKER